MGLFVAVSGVGEGEAELVVGFAIAAVLVSNVPEGENDEMQLVLCGANVP